MNSVHKETIFTLLVQQDSDSVQALTSGTQKEYLELLTKARGCSINMQAPLASFSIEYHSHKDRTSTFRDINFTFYLLNRMRIAGS